MINLAAIFLLPSADVLLNLDTVYILTGVVLLVFALLTFTDRGNRRRYSSGVFWLLLAIAFIFGTWMPHGLTGLLVLAMVAIDGVGRVTRGEYQEATKAQQAKQAVKLKNKIFWPVLAIPLVTFAFALAFRFSGFDSNAVNRAALVGLGVGGVVAMGLALRITGGTMPTMFNEGRRINDAMGSLSLLPQLLASLGVIFTAAKIGDLIASGIQQIIPANSLFLLVMANCIGMTIFTIVMGNSFAAFPVIASGVLVPLLVKPFGVDPAMAAILTLTAGSSGTLMTPMAANFNIVPTALLNMKDPYGVIKFQLPFAVTIWMLHVVLMWIMIKIM
ncbi:MAG: DUF979 domain-containing protein [Acidobacteria bacterium]|nr:DUF979 domain-containing protein [Acidobacteriota bacterium]